MPNIGIISFAHMHAYSYAQCLSDLAEVNFSAVWDDDAKRGRAAAKEHGATFYASLNKMLANNLDAVIICSENIHHCAHAEAAASAGLWILCEKPLATTVADAKAMITACTKAGVGLGTAFPCRYVDTLQDFRNRIGSGEIGTPLAAACTNNGQNPGGWFVDEGLSGGGAVMDHTVHVADVMRWITGKEFTKVYCEKASLIHPETPTDDIGSLHLEMEDGLKLTHVASWNRPQAFPTWGDVTIDMTGTKGSLYIDAFNQKVDVYDNNASRAQWAPYGKNADLALVKNFVEAVTKQVQPSVSGEDGLRAVQITVAAEKSAKIGKMIRI
ncbi:MAG: Gfo/Idh/MocA family oxidoreductase [Candidatus Hydrogenedentota bacterium]